MSKRIIDKNGSIIIVSDDTPDDVEEFDAIRLKKLNTGTKQQPSAFSTIPFCVFVSFEDLPRASENFFVVQTNKFSLTGDRVRLSGLISSTDFGRLVSDRNRAKIKLTVEEEKGIATIPLVQTLCSIIRISGRNMNALTVELDLLLKADV